MQICFVLDVDGAAGKQTLQRIIDTHGALPETIGALTGNGFHSYLAYPADENITIRNLTSRSADGSTLEGLYVRRIFQEYSTGQYTLGEITKKQLLGFVFLNLSLKSGELQYFLREPFDLYVKAGNIGEWRARKDSNL